MPGDDLYVANQAHEPGLGTVFGKRVARRAASLRRTVRSLGIAALLSLGACTGSEPSTSAELQNDAPDTSSSPSSTAVANTTAAASPAVANDEGQIPGDSVPEDSASGDSVPGDGVSATEQEPQLSGEADEAVELRFEGSVAAPEFPAGYDWFNVSRPLSMNGDLRGKIVLLDFWTQGCINCIHIIPDLHRLEQEYPDELVVVAVHWAKFDSERTSQAVREASIRYGRQHPIVNDNAEILRGSYGVNAWPTVALVDPKGMVVGNYAGEGVYAALEPVIAIMADEYGRSGLIDDTPLDDLLDIAPALPTVLSFPGKVLADSASGRLFIADTGRHRILVATLSGELLDVIGTGTPGRSDGGFATASLREPQGMALALDGDTLYIADRANHLIRAADLNTRSVTTVAGTGEPATAVLPGVATQAAIASPWDLHLEGSLLFIAGAGRHQLWTVDLESGNLNVFAGTGAEGLRDDFRLSATLSQPSGLAGGYGVIYFTDPEASAVRQVSLGVDGLLNTLVGQHLFVWGDAVGSFQKTRLQHAIGIEFVAGTQGAGRLYIADTYNHRIKVLDLEAKSSSVVVGDGTPGLSDGFGTRALLAEPSGLSATADTLYIADTNNHRIRTLDLATGELATLALSNLELATVTMGDEIADEVLTPPKRIAPGPVDIVLDLVLPDGYKFNTEGLFRFEWSTENDLLSPQGTNRYEARGPDMPLRLAASAEADTGTAHGENPGADKSRADSSAMGGTVLSATATVYYCPAVDETFCLVRDVNFTVPLVVDAAGASSVQLTHQLQSAQELERRLESG